MAVRILFFLTKIELKNLLKTIYSKTYLINQELNCYQFTKRTEKSLKHKTKIDINPIEVVYGFNGICLRFRPSPRVARN
jgi:hypothetical protein